MASPDPIPPKFLSKPNELGVVAVGFSGGQGKPGVDTAPAALLSAGLLTQLQRDLGYTIHHDGTIHSYASLIPQLEADPPIRGMKRPRAVSNVTHRIAQQVYEQAHEGRLTLTLGGDHSIAVGTIAGTSLAIEERRRKRKREEGGAAANGADGNDEDGIGVIWVDAHADINTPGLSESGNIHGMPVAFLTGLSQRELKEQSGSEVEEDDVFGWLSRDEEITGGAQNGAGQNGSGDGSTSTIPNSAGHRQNPRLNVKKLVYIGLRDVDRAEKEILRREGIKAFSMHDIDRHGIAHITSLALAHLGPNTPIHLSFDVDALDPHVAPSTGTPVRGGLTLREGDFLAESVWMTGQLVAMDLVEVNPVLGAEGTGEGQETVTVGVGLVRSGLGDSLL